MHVQNKVCQTVQIPARNDHQKRPIPGVWTGGGRVGGGSRGLPAIRVREIFLHQVCITQGGTMCEFNCFGFTFRIQMVDFLLAEERIWLLQTVRKPLICDLPKIKVVTGCKTEKWNSGF